MSGRLENDSFKLLDTVVSMNGFHAFLDKQKAFHEIWRVLKPGGDFIACFYPMRRKTPCFSCGECQPIEYDENDEPTNL